MAKYDIPFDIAIEYTSADLKRLKFQDLQRTASSIFKEARKRIKELEKIEPEYGTSPVLRNYRRNEPFSARYKTRSQLMEEISRAEIFLSRRTSSAEQFIEDIKDLDKELGFETSLEFRNQLYEMYAQWKEINDIKEQHGASRVYFNVFKREVAKSFKENYGAWMGESVIGFGTIFKNMSDKFR